jgi:hypothetical protein
VDLGALAPAGLPKDVTPEEIAALAAAAAQMQGRIAETKTQEPPSEVPTNPPVETTKPESRNELRSEAQPEGSVPAATFAEQMAQAQSEAKPAEATLSTSISDSQSHPASAEPAADEPVTMAVGGSTLGTVPSRWAAVSVALAPEDAAISLEQEMQKAYAAFAAAETGHAASTPNFTESGSAALTSASTETVSSESVLAVPASAAPEAAQALTAVASAATDAMSAAAEQLQAVAASYVEQKEPVPSVAAETSSTPAPAEQRDVPPVAHAEALEANKPKIESEPLPAGAVLRAEELKDSTHVADGPSQSEVSAESSVAAVSPSADVAFNVAGQPEAPMQKESDMAASTAAAWANAQASQNSSGQSSEPSSPQEMAAKAVAAGAESSPEEVAADAGSDIASIVDSVLAGLRPKIVEEISRKLGKKN